MNDVIKNKLKILPSEPGCYLMMDKLGTIIYVGKAKVLKNRVRSYFSGAHDQKTMVLVSEICDFTYIVTSSNMEALILEMNLIQKHQPKYNIKLKDDKSYPFIKITNEKHPIIKTTRTVLRDKAKYFGPFPNSSAANETVRLLDRIYPFRKCDPLQKKLCLYFHINQCLGACEKTIDPKEYDIMTSGVIDFLNGNVKEIKQLITEKMLTASKNLEFENAKEYRDQLAAIEATMEKQKVSLNDQLDRDVFGFFVDKGYMSVQVFFIRQGKLIERQAAIFEIYNEPKEEMLTFLGLFYSQPQNLKPKEIILPEEINAKMAADLLKTKIYQPMRGLKSNLLKLAIKNAEIALSEKFSLAHRAEERTINAIKTIGELLNIKTPHRIEAFDNSNIYGVDPVSAMVVFVDGKAAKKEYRKFKIKTVVGANDYESMREVVRRRYVRLLKENLPMPDLIIIDGGKGHIKAVREVLEDELNTFIPIAGLVKDEKHKTSDLLFGDPLKIVPLSRSSQAFYLLQRIQDEVHRFAITFHRQTRKKNTFSSVLDEISGIGAKRKKLLLKHFGSTKNIKTASSTDIIKLGIPKTIAEQIVKHLNEK